MCKRLAVQINTFLNLGTKMSGYFKPKLFTPVRAPSTHCTRLGRPYSCLDILEKKKIPDLPGHKH
jgi:hypothetical protein